MLSVWHLWQPMSIPQCTSTWPGTCDWLSPYLPTEPCPGGGEVDLGDDGGGVRRDERAGVAGCQEEAEVLIVVDDLLPDLDHVAGTCGHTGGDRGKERTAITECHRGLHLNHPASVTPIMRAADGRAPKDGCHYCFGCQGNKMWNYFNGERRMKIELF